MTFKKGSIFKHFGKFEYYPQRDVNKEPITTIDLMQIASIPENNAGKNYREQHLQYINTMISREFVSQLAANMMEEAGIIQAKFSPDKLGVEEICVWLAHGYCFAMTESLFEMARKGLISGACRDAIWEMAMFSQMEKQGSTKIILHSLYRGFEISRINVSVDEDQVLLSALDLTTSDSEQNLSGPLIISMDISKCTPPVIDRMNEVLRLHPGDIEVHLRLVDGDKKTVMKLDDSLRVNSSLILKDKLKTVLGSDCLNV